MIGPNGAGKSATLKTISRMIDVEPDSRLSYIGKDMLKYSADKAVSELGISHVPEGRRLEERQSKKAETLSGGEQQMLAVTRAFISGRKIILLAEPSMALAPVLMMSMFKALKEINNEGTTILLVEQNACMALQFSERGYLLANGDLVMEGRSKVLLEKPEVQKVYLGG